MAGDEDKALATLRAAHAKGLRFSEAELDNLVDGSEIYNTQSALVLEDLIAKFLVGRVSDEP